ncbi:uncharacterized protein LOC114297236 [Camellia sinensis]|uniref:uncharacterized protein LOC114297236 n=1 Tax=Camellia sinensis TaxID=4442 RepID=UPI001036312D|nr:uncharacterized protein LOC114297236 [Camellia sinensis]
MKLLSWNIRGFGRPEKRRRIRSLLKERKIDFAFFQETKKEGMSDDLVRSIWHVDELEYMVVNADGSAGGLLCVWKPSVFSLSQCCGSRRFLLLSGTLLPDFRCVLVNVYAPNDAVCRRQVWKVITSLNLGFPDPWCVGGDFNEIRDLGDRRGCLRRDKGMVEFNEFIEGLALYDVPMHGRQFSWSNSEDGGKWSRIDRVLLAPEWLSRFNFKLWGLPRGVSDHCPLVLMEDERDWGPKPFRFLNAWLLHPN